MTPWTDTKLTAAIEAHLDVRYAAARHLELEDRIRVVSHITEPMGLTPQIAVVRPI